MITQLPYGLKEGKLISIRDVEKGLACDCICPSCKGVLVARKGDVRNHHFAHHSGDDCEHGIETALHLAAKEVIKQLKIFTIPPLEVSDERVSYRIIELSDKMKIKFDEVHLEVYIDNMKPDIIAKIGDKELMIEIAVTHFIDEQKYQKIKAKGISSIEINLQELKDGFSQEDLIRLVIEGVENKSWIFNAREKELLENYINEKEHRLKEEQKQKRERKQRAIRSNFDIITANKQDGESFCPMMIQEHSRYMKNNDIISDLRAGKLWNGNIYGQGINSRYLFIEGKKREIFPEQSDLKLSADEHEIRKKKYGQLKRISRNSRIDYDECEKCQYFGEHLDNSSFSCGFRKENKLK